MANSSQNPKKNMAGNFQQALNDHGYGFHHAVLNVANELSRSPQSFWGIEHIELPVGLGANTTRIDVLLRRRARQMDYADLSNAFIVGECKRVNPAYADWCFAPSSFARFPPHLGDVVWERVLQDDLQQVSSSPYQQSLGERARPYHIAFELKTDQKGSSTGGSKGQIEAYVTQVLRGANGMVDFLASRPNLFGPSQDFLIIPVIFTTAKLWVSKVDLAEADLESGNIALEKVAPEECNWVFYSYTMSQGLKHSRVHVDDSKSYTISDIIEREYERTVVIVTARAIAPFLEWSSKALGVV